MDSNVKWLNLGLEGLDEISTTILVRWFNTVTYVGVNACLAVIITLITAAQT
jgi:hypothetical protein